MMRTSRLVVCGLGAVALAGCATPGYNSSRIQSELVKAGTTPTQARCVTDGLTSSFDEGELGTHSPPSAAEIATTRKILVKCKVTLPLAPLR